MKKHTFYSLIALGAVLSGATAQAQTKVSVSTSTNATPAPVSSPAVQPDTLAPNHAGMAMPQGTTKEDRINRRNNRKNRVKTTKSLPSDTSSYRRDASGNGTALNNSNVTNYNSQNAIAPPTGVNAVPAVGESVRTPSGTVSTGSTMGTPTNTGSSAVAAAPTPGQKASPDRQGTAANRSATLTVGDFIAGSPNYTTLQNALQTATLDKTLKGAGPFTVFAPSNEAFKKLPDAMQRVLLEGHNLDALTLLLSYHVVSGEVNAAELVRRISAGGGKETLKTVAGHLLTAKMGDNGRVVLTDEQGGTARIDATDFYQANGVVHGLDHVLLITNSASLFK